MNTEASHPPLPPFDAETGALKVRLAEDAWNSRDPEHVLQLCCEDTRWRNRSENPIGQAAVRALLQRKWARMLDYRVIKELWVCDGHRLAVRFASEWRDDSGQWFLSHGNEFWEFNPAGLLLRRQSSANDRPIREGDRQYHWPLGRRPDRHPGLSELGL